jgi:hypothetical protein
MRKMPKLFLAMLLSFAFDASAQDTTLAEGNPMTKDIQETRIRIAFNDEEAVVMLFDNPVSRDFVSLLPLTATFEDYAGTEKIAYLPRKLATQSGLSGRDVQGDFTYYAPWGNLAVFYKGFGNAGELYILGRIESEKEKLAGMSRNFSVRIEVME